MTESSDRVRMEILAALPDIPRWVETRGMLLSGRCEVLARGRAPGDLLVRSRAHPLLSISGRPPLDPLSEAVRDPLLGVVLCDPARAAEAGARLPGWRRVAAVIHSLDGAGPAPVQPPAGIEIGILPRPEASLRHLPDALREEIERALDGGHVTAAFLEGRPVSFCYPVYETETLWDVSIDTLEAYRRRGLAAACVDFLVDHMRRHGKEPVWGALADNAPSLALAARLGFAPTDEMTVFSRA